MAARRITVVYNSKSGKGQQNPSADTLRDLFSQGGATVDIARLDKSTTIEQLVERAINNDSDVVVAAGGDGTIRGVAEALAGTGTPMGILAFGTFNYFARSLGLPEPLDQAIHVILNGEVRRVRTGRINGTLFLNNTSVGRYPEILANREEVYHRWGRSRLAAYWSVLKTLLTLRRPLEIEIDADGTLHTLRTPLIFVLNNAYQMEQMSLDGQKDLAAGKLVMYLSPDSGRFGMLRQALALAMGRAQKGRDFQMLSAKQFKVRARRKSHRVALDGERRRLRVPFDIGAVSDELLVVVPDHFTREVR